MRSGEGRDGGHGRSRLRAAGCALALCLALLAAPTAGAADEARAGEGGADKGAAEAGPDTWFAETVIQGDGGVRIMQSWSKGRKLRVETSVGGQLLVTVVNGDYYYNLIPTAGVGIAIQRSPRALADDQKGGRPFGHDGERFVARGAEKARTERLMGKELVVYRLTTEEAREEVWVTDDAEKLPVKHVYTDKKGGNSGESMWSWHRGLEIADSFFDPDPRVKIEKMTYEEFVKRVKEGKAPSFPPLFIDLLAGRPETPPS